MDLNKLPIFAMVTQRMAWLAKRQEVLAQNIANADTPGYRPRDLTAQSFRKLLQAAQTGRDLGLKLTDKGHISQLRSAGGFRADVAKGSFDVAPSGNAVSIEEEMMKVSETQNSYRLATNLYRKHVAMIKAAIGRR